uniref:Uncharacterized protein n=1 Tax=Romanomermis culicivorax TaxID=13658 RepID=A0A915K374_ROMCU
YSALGDAFKGQSVGPTEGGETGSTIRSDSARRVCRCGLAGKGIKTFLGEVMGVLDQQATG